MENSRPCEKTNFIFPGIQMTPLPATGHIMCYRQPAPRNGHWWKGLFLLAWGAIVVGTADNIIRPLIIARQVKLHPLLLLFSLIGGVQQFGFVGLFIGPVVMSVIFALLDMLREEIGEISRKPAAP